MNTWQEALAYVTDQGIVALVLLAFTNMLLGTAVALKNGEFKLYYLAGILKKVGPMLLAYIAVAVVMGNETLTLAVYAVSTADLLGDIVKNLGYLYPSLGEKLPNMFIEPEFKRAAYNAHKHTSSQRLQFARSADEGK